MATVSEAWQSQVLVSRQNDQNSFTLLTGMQNHTSTLQTSWAVFCKLLPPYNPGIPLLFLPREMKIQCAHKNLYTDVYSSFNHYSPKLDAPPTTLPCPPACEQITSGAVLHWNAPRPWEWRACCYGHLDERPLHYAKWKKPDSWGSIPYASIYRTLQKWQN